MRLMLVPVLLGLVGTLLAGTAFAHDDPVVTVRVLCDGFNVLDMDAVLGEISDTATLTVDRPVHGTAEIEAWVRDQMDHDLRIEIVDMGVPQKLPDGYTLGWTARLSRQDWRQAGAPTREARNSVTIHNGRITEWRASLSDVASPSAADASPASAVTVTQPPADQGFPSLFGIPVTLLFAAGAVLGWGAWMLRRFVR